MTAPALLEALRRSGVSVQSDGAALTLDGPGAVIDSLLPEVARFKLALLELLTAPEASSTSSAPAISPEPPATEPATVSPFRTVAPFLLVPAKIETAPGAVAICEVLQTFRSLFAAARGGDLPQQVLEIEIAGELHPVENAAAAILDLEIAWTEAARQCQKEKRDLTEVEAAALGAAAALLNHVWACYDGPGAAAWLDLGALNSQLDADFAQMLQKQRKRGAVQSEATP
jgi:hypothetical protein